MAPEQARTIEAELKSRRTAAHDLALSNVRHVQQMLERRGK